MDASSCLTNYLSRRLLRRNHILFTRRFEFKVRPIALRGFKMPGIARDKDQRFVMILEQG